MNALNIGIVGGGVGGLAAAIALQKFGHRVTVFEQASRYERDANYETYWPSSRPKPQQEIPKRRARP